VCATPVVERWDDDATALDLLALHAHNPERYPFLLESVAQNARIGRYDILFAFPQERLQGEAALHALAQTSVSAASFASSSSQAGTQLPFVGGWFLFLPYELAQDIEPSLRGKVAAADLEIQMVRCPAALIRDHEDQSLWLVSEEGEHLADLRADLAAAKANPEPDLEPPSSQDLAIAEAEGSAYRGQVEQILDYIRAGDVFQVNLSREWTAQRPASVSAATLYRALRKTNPAPFAALAALDAVTILSSSPERLVEVKDGTVQTRPIAGTRPRGTSAQDDAQLAAELLAHRKEQAEHVMLIDLERNDLGRVAVPGSVVVDEHMVLESYAHVHHIVSNVRAQLRENMSALDVIRAVFPGGTITGCPKVRCMEIIGELEQSPRGVYTGSLGYLDQRGHLDLNILIRTLELRGNEIRFRTGAGIVADSIPEAELEETRAKAKGLIKGLAAASCVAKNADNLHA
jgi:anthranilate synthase component 1